MQYNLLFQNHLLLWNFLRDFRGGVADFLKASFSYSGGQNIVDTLYMFYLYALTLGENNF